MKKLLSVALVLAMLLSAAAVLAEDTEYVFEAEYTELEGLEGLGVSGSPTGIGLVTENAKASNGYFVGNLGTASPITFIIKSDADAVATMKMTVGSNILGSCVWNPTTLKILGAYDRMGSQGVSGENIDATMTRVEGMLGTVVTAFEKQLDALFGAEAMDISTDITVLVSLMHREGLVSDELHEAVTDRVDDNVTDASGGTAAADAADIKLEL